MTDYESSEAVRKWMGRLAPSTQVVQGNYFKAFMSWLGEHGEKFRDFTPDQLIEYQREATNGTRFEILDLAQKYVSAVPGTYNTKNSRHNNIRSFFLHNRTELPRDKSYSMRAEREPIKGTLTPEMIRDALMGCRPVYRAIYLSMFQGALDQEMFTYWNLNGYEDLVKQLKADPEVIMISLPGRKKRKNEGGFYTFIGGDAIDAIRVWLKHRPEDSKAIFVGQYGEPLGKDSLRQYWIKRLRRLGYVDPVKLRTRADKTGKGLHEMRDVWRSLWSKSPASSTVGEYLMGHNIDELGYDKSFKDVDYYRGEYVKALPYLQIVSSGEAFGQVDKGEVEKLRAQVKALEAGQGGEVQALRAELAELKRIVTEKLSRGA